LWDFHGFFSDEERLEIFEAGRDSAWDIMQNKEETARWATGHGLAIIVEAICENQQKVLPCSVEAAGEYGYSEVSFGMPVVLGRRGVEEIVELDLSTKEVEKLSSSVNAIEQACESWEPQE
jgi:malate dehydrogenase